MNIKERCLLDIPLDLQHHTSKVQETSSYSRLIGLNPLCLQRNLGLSNSPEVFRDTKSDVKMKRSTFKVLFLISLLPRAYVEIAVLTRFSFDEIGDKPFS